MRGDGGQGWRRWLRYAGGCLLMNAAGWARAQTVPAQRAIAYGKTGGPALTMDYYPGRAVGSHPIAMILHGTGEVLRADALAESGYDVFSIQGSEAGQGSLPAALAQVERAIRYVRFHAREWNADVTKIVLIGESSDAYLSIAVDLENASGVAGSEDAVDRESARVAAVVALFGASGGAAQVRRESVRALLDPLLEEKRTEASLARATDNYINPDAAPVLMMNVDEGGVALLEDASGLQKELREVGVRCELVRAAQGAASANATSVPDWERQMLGWLDKMVKHKSSE